MSVIKKAYVLIIYRVDVSDITRIVLSEAKENIDRVYTTCNFIIKCKVEIK